MNINDMFNEAQDAPDQGDLLGAADLPKGEVVLAEIVYSKAGETKKGAPSWTNKLRIVEGEYEGGEFFDSVFTSAKSTDGARSYNKRQFAKLQATGLGAQFFSTNPSAEAISKAIKGKRVLVKIDWQTPDGFDSLQEAIDAGERVFGQHTWTPADSTPAGGPEGFSSTPSGF